MYRNSVRSPLWDIKNETKGLKIWAITVRNYHHFTHTKLLRLLSTTLKPLQLPQVSTPRISRTSHQQQAFILSISQHALLHHLNNSRLLPPFTLRHSTSFYPLCLLFSPFFQIFKLTRCLFQVLSATLLASESLQTVTFRGDYGGHAYELNGTAQSVLAQLKGLYPEVELPKRSTVNVESCALLKKDKVSPSNPFNSVRYFERNKLN